MPVYMYRREDGTTFEYKQKFSDDPLATDPDTGQNVVRVVQSTGIIFKGSGFYVNDSKGSKKSLNMPKNTSENASKPADSGESKSDGDKATKSETKTETTAKSDTAKGSSSAAS